MNPFVYDLLSFLDYDLDCPLLDTEWLLSTLFDASLLSTSKAAGNGGSFFAPHHDAGNHKKSCSWTLVPGARNDLFIISRRLRPVA
jgi:hypothetical protein